VRGATQRAGLADLTLLAFGITQARVAARLLEEPARVRGTALEQVLAVAAELAGSALLRRFTAGLRTLDLEIPGDQLAAENEACDQQPREEKAEAKSCSQV
jgi:hypothetical protein